MKGVLRLLLLVATIEMVLSQVLRENPMFRSYLNTGDIGEFCDAYRKQFDRECKEHISEDVENQFAKLATSAGDYRLRAFMDEHIMVTDPMLEMDENECLDFYDRVEEVPNNQVADVVGEYILAKGYNFNRREFKSLKAIRETAEGVKSSDSCNLGFHARHLGEISKGWKLKYLDPLLIKSRDTIKVIKNKALNYYSSEDQESSPYGQADIDKIEPVECHKMRNDDLIQNTLGMRAIELIEGDASIKATLIFLSKCVCYYRMYQAMDNIELVIRSLVFLRNQLLTIVSLIVGFVAIKYLKLMHVRRFLGWMRSNKAHLRLIVSVILLTTAGLHKAHAQQDLACVAAFTSVVYCVGSAEDDNKAMRVLNMSLVLYLVSYFVIAPMGAAPLVLFLSMSILKIAKVFSLLRLAFQWFSPHNHLQDGDLDERPIRHGPPSGGDNPLYGDLEH